MDLLRDDFDCLSLSTGFLVLSPGSDCTPIFLQEFDNPAVQSVAHSAIAEEFICSGRVPSIPSKTGCDSPPANPRMTHATGHVRHASR
jgi:hypothetical protein